LGHRSLPRRATDWIESAALCVLIAASLVAAVAAVQVGLLARADVLRQARLEPTRTPITVQLAQDATVAVEDGDAAPIGAPVHWRDRGGVERTGVVQVRGPLKAGDQVVAWVDPTGNLVAPPVTGDEAAMIAIVTTGLSLIAVFVVASAAWSVLRRLVLAVNRVRWKREWAAVEPLWSGRQHRS
jgi:hypothetical protein